MEKHLYRMGPATILHLTCINAGNAAWTATERTKTRKIPLSFVDSFTSEGKNNTKSVMVVEGMRAEE